MLGIFLGFVYRVINKMDKIFFLWSLYVSKKKKIDNMWDKMYNIVDSNKNRGKYLK